MEFTICFCLSLFQEIVWELLSQALERSMNANGIVIGGYPRDLDQLREFEEKVRIAIQLLYL